LKTPAKWELQAESGNPVPQTVMVAQRPIAPIDRRSIRAFGLATVSVRIHGVGNIDSDAS
jgi:hypothetical protein